MKVNNMLAMVVLCGGVLLVLGYGLGEMVTRLALRRRENRVNNRFTAAEAGLELLEQHTGKDRDYWIYKFIDHPAVEDEDSVPDELSPRRLGRASGR